MDKLVFIPPTVLFLAGLLWLGLGVQQANEGRITIRTDMSENVRTSMAGTDTVNAGTVVDLVLEKKEGRPESGTVFWLVKGPLDTLGFHTKEPSLRLTRLGNYKITAFENQRAIYTSEVAVVEGRKVMTETGPTDLRAGQTFTASDRSNFAASKKRWMVSDESGRIVAEEEDQNEFKWKTRTAGDYKVALIYLDEAGNEISRNTTSVAITAPPPPKSAAPRTAPTAKPAGDKSVILSLAETALPFYYNFSDPKNEASYLMLNSYSAKIQPSEELMLNHFIAYLKAGKYELSVFKNGNLAFQEKANLGSDRAWEFGLSKLGRIASKDRIEIKLSVTEGSAFARPANAANLQSDYFNIDFEGGNQWIFNVDMNVQGQ